MFTFKIIYDVKFSQKVKQRKFKTTIVHFSQPALAHTSSLDTDLTRNTRAPHFTPQHWLLCHMGLY